MSGMIASPRSAPSLDQGATGVVRSISMAVPPIRPVDGGGDDVVDVLACSTTGAGGLRLSTVCCVRRGSRAGTGCGALASCLLVLVHTNRKNKAASSPFHPLSL